MVQPSLVFYVCLFVLIRVRCPQPVLHLGMLHLAPRGSVMPTRPRVSLSSLLAQQGSSGLIVTCWKNLQHVIKDSFHTSRVYSRGEEGQRTTPAISCRTLFGNLYYHSLFIRGNNTKDKHLLMQYMASCCLHANAYYSKSAMKTQMCERTSYKWALSW